MNPSERVITWEELSSHVNRQSLWVLIEGKIYDVTTYLAEHPGGDDILIKYAGIDATKKFEDIKHTPYARSLRDQRLVGSITSAPMPKNYESNVKQNKKGIVNPNKLYTWDEVATHSTKDDLWVVVNQKVYDVTDFINEHPGGPAVLLGRAGDDATGGFNDANHSKNATEQLKGFQVGIVSGPNPKRASSGSNTTMIAALLIVLIAIVGLILRFK